MTLTEKAKAAQQAISKERCYSFEEMLQVQKELENLSKFIIKKG